MTKLAKFIVNHKIIIVCVFLVLVVMSVVGLMFVKQNSDIQSYLSPDSVTAEGRDALYEHFDIQGEASIAVKTNNVEFLNKFVTSAKDRPFLKDFMWAGNFAEIKNMIDQDPLVAFFLKENFAKLESKFIKTAEDGTSIYVLSAYFSESSTSDVVINYVNELDSAMKTAEKDGVIDEYFLGGMAVGARDTLESTLGELPIYLLIALLLLIVILSLTSKSWLEPFILIVTLGISILLNMGSNVIFEEVSTITFSASSILQLALAMDYSIFLMHCFYGERNRNPLLDAKTCMERALPKTLKSVAASALTTVGGFIALFFMDFGMGIDLGSVLAKGVLLSLLTVIFLQPVLIISASKFLDKTKHKYFTPKLVRTTKIATKIRKPLLIVALLFVIPCFIGQLNVPLNYLSTTAEVKDKTETQVIIDASSNQLIMVVPKGSDDEADYAKHYKFLAQAESIKGIDNGLSFYSVLPRELYELVINQYPDIMEEVGGTLFGGGYALYTFEITTGVESVATYAALDEIKALAENLYGNDIFITGMSQAAKDLAAVTPTDFLKVSLISAAIIFLILLLTYRSFIMAGVLLFVIELGIWINLSIVATLGIPLNFMSYIIISSVQLGATVDYAILAASKFREVKEEGVKDNLKAIVEGIKRASPSILVSAAILFSVCISVYFIASNIIIGEITLLIAAGAITSTLLVFFLLPGILLMVQNAKDKRINKKLVVAGIPDLQIENDEIVESDLVDEKEVKKHFMMLKKRNIKDVGNILSKKDKSDDNSDNYESSHDKENNELHNKTDD